MRSFMARSRHSIWFANQRSGSSQRFVIDVNPLWQTYFADCHEIIAGEVVIETFDRVEDTKGNSGDEGRLTVSNLRLLWQSRSKPRINLSVGLSCITSIANRTLHNKLRGKYEALHIMTKVKTRKSGYAICKLCSRSPARDTNLYSRNSESTVRRRSTQLRTVRDWPRTSLASAKRTRRRNCFAIWNCDQR